MDTRYGVDENGLTKQTSGGKSSTIGKIITHFGTTAPPGTLVCDGSEVSREVYAELYQEIGALVGQGDGSTTFNLPDLRGRWLMGADAERTAGTEVAEGLPNVTGRFVLYNGSGVGMLAQYHTPPFSYDPDFMPQGPYTISGPESNNGDQTMSFDLSTANPIYGAQDHVTPASVAVLPCIVYE